MHGVAFGHAPTHLLDAAVPLSTLPGRAHLQSADNGQYDVRTTGVIVADSSVGSRDFSVAGPQAWNRLVRLPTHISSSNGICRDFQAPSEN